MNNVIKESKTKSVMQYFIVRLWQQQQQTTVKENPLKQILQMTVCSLRTINENCQNCIPIYLNDCISKEKKKKEKDPDDQKGFHAVQTVIASE